MSYFEWTIVIVACIFIVGFGYAGVTGKSIFNFRHNKHSHKRKH